MDTKISSDVWDDPEFIELQDQAKLAFLWLLTNARINVAGYAEFSEKVFCFQTACPPDALGMAFAGMAKGIVRVGRKYWLRNFIRWQFGDGNQLVKNTMALTIVRHIRNCPEEIIAAALGEYPELVPLYEKMGTPSPCHGLREGEGEGEREGEREQGVQGEPRARRRRTKTKPGATLPSEQPEPLRSRMLAVGALKRREATTAWGANEMEAFRAQRLDTLSEADFEAQLAPLRAYYGAPIPRREDFRRRELLTLLHHWAGELDKAKAWVRDNDDGLKRM